MQRTVKVIPSSGDSNNCRYISDSNEDGNKKLQTLLESLYSFLMTMKLFGCYFENKHWIENTGGQKSRRWRMEFWRAYSTFLLCITWANSFRYLAAFNAQTEFGPELLLKFNYLGALLIGSCGRTAFYFACINGRILKTLTDISKLNLNFERFRKITMMLTVCFWPGMIFSAGTYVYHGLIYKGFPMISNYQIEPFPTYFKLSSHENVLLNIILIFISQFNGAGGGVPFYFIFILAYILQQEFMKIKLELENQLQSDNEIEAPSTQTITSIQFEKYHRRHQHLTKIVREADKFVCVLNGIGIVAMITTTILTLYSVSFYTRIYNDFVTQFTYSCYIIAAVSMLAMMSGSAILINEAVKYKFYSITEYSNGYWFSWK